MKNNNIDVNINIHNRFDIEVIDARSGEVKQKAQALNVVCDNLFSNIGVSGGDAIVSSYGNYIQYGSGSGTPSTSDTTLFTYSGYKITDMTDFSTYSNDVINNVASRRYKAILGVDDGNGVNITEVGLSSSSQGNLATHAMLQDMNGNPISINKTNTDIINIYATVYVHYSASDTIRFFTVSDIERRYWTASILGYGVRYDGNGYSADQQWGLTKSSLAYKITTGIRPSISKPTNKSFTLTFRRINVDEGNINGLRFISSHRGRYWSGITTDNYFPLSGWADCIIDAKQFGGYTKTGESVGVGNGSTTKFKTKFDYPYNAKVYVNGVEQQSGVTVKRAPVSSYISGRFIQIHSRSTENHKILVDYTPNSSNSATYGNEGMFYATGVSVYENLLAGIGEGPTTFRGQISNDLVNWTSVSGTLTAAQRAYKYFKPSEHQNMTSSFDGYNVIFDSAPANGDVITIDYTTDYIPKDSDHVLDVTLNVSLGAYSGQ